MYIYAYACMSRTPWRCATNARHVYMHMHVHSWRTSTCLHTCTHMHICLCICTGGGHLVQVPGLGTGGPRRGRTPGRRPRAFAVGVQRRRGDGNALADPEAARGVREISLPSCTRMCMSICINAHMYMCIYALLCVCAGAWARPTLLPGRRATFSACSTSTLGRSSRRSHST